MAGSNVGLKVPLKKGWTMTTYDQLGDLANIEGQTIPLAEFFANLPEE